MDKSDNNATLKAAGWGYLVGDAALFAAGLMAKEKLVASTGAVFALGGLAAARYGKPKAERQLSRLNHNLRDFFAREGIDIPAGSTLSAATLAEPRGLVNRVEDFLYDHPSEVLNTMFALGGGMMIRSGLKNGKSWDAASGALVTAGALAGLFIPENHEKKHSGVLGWIEEKPLRISGALYALNNVALIGGGLRDFKTKPENKAYVLKFLTAAAYIVANGLLFVSSKEENRSANLSPQQRNSLETAAAQVIAAQPKELREALIQRVAGHLSDQKTLGLNAEKFSGELRDQLDALTLERASQPSWQMRVKNSEREHERS